MGSEQSSADGIGQRRKDTALRLVEAIAAKDRDAASACIGDAVTWWVPQSAAARGLARPIVGREAVLDLLCGTSAYRAGTMRWSHQHALYDDGIVVLHSSLQATTAAGHDYDNQYCLLYRFEGDAVVEAWEHTDTAYAFSRFQQ